MFDYILSTMFIIGFVYLLVSKTKLKIQNNKLKLMIVQSEIDKKALSDKLSTVSLSETSHEEAFVKFLGQSREWAFKYIEDVQEAIKKFKDDAGPSIDYYKNYSDVMWTPLHDLFAKIVVAYEELIKVLPEDHIKDEV